MVRFDPRDRDPSCLACGFVIYHDEPLPYDDQEARPPSYAASIGLEERKRAANVRWRRKRRGAPPHSRGVVL